MPTLPAGTYFFPANLPHYVTKWQLAGARESRFSVVVQRGATGVVIRPVFDVDLSVLLSGTWGYFCSGISCEEAGFFTTGWEPINEDAAFIGGVYIGVVLEVASDIDSEALMLGLAEVRIR